MTVTICHSPADLEPGGDLHRYLLENFVGDVCRRVIDTSVREAVDFALSGDRVIVLLSPGAVPEVQEGWQEVLLHNHVFYLLVRDCRFPALIQRNRPRFSDARTNRVAAHRTAKRWLLGHSIAEPPEMDEELRRTLADKPGFAESDLASANRFAKQSAAEFEQVCFIDGRGRTAPSLLHELRKNLGGRARVLVLLRGASRELADAIAFPPFASVLRTPLEEAPAEDAGQVRTQLIAALNSPHDVNEAAFDRALQATSDPDFVRWQRRG